MELETFFRRETGERSLRFGRLGFLGGRHRRVGDQKKIVSKTQLAGESFHCKKN